MRTYLDHNATSSLRSTAREAMMAAMAGTGNPSSVHADGRAARRILENARESIAQLVNAAADSIVFTSGGTEAATLALSGWGGDQIIVSPTEHACVLEAASDAHTVDVDSDGVVDVESLRRVLATVKGPSLVACMAANNETGVIQPVKEIIEIAHEYGARVLVDAVQIAGKLPILFDEWGVDYLTLSAHKLGGPAGVGALIVRDGVPLGRAVKGGGQEKGRRGGSENIVGIAGFGAAVKDRIELMASPSPALDFQERLENGIERIAPDAVIFCKGRDRLANTTCFAVPGITSETALIAFDLEGISISSGSACSSGKVAASHVLEAMGVDGALSRSALRVSTGWTTTVDDIDRFLTVFKTLNARLRPDAQIIAKTLVDQKPLVAVA